MTTMQQLSSSQVSPEVPINENFESLSASAIFSKRHPVTTGLTWGYHGGLYNGNTIADGTVTLTNTADNYVVVLRSNGVVSTSTTNTNSLDSLYAKLYKVACAGGVVTTVVDQRFDANGLLFAPAGASQPLDSDLTTISGLTATTDNFLQAKSSAWASRTVAQVSVDLQATGLVADAVGFRTIPQNSQSTAYTTVAADSGKHILHPSADTTARTFTIDSNANVAYPVGTAITFVNQASAGVMTIAITSDTMRLAGAGTTGSRTLAANGVATALKLTSTEWIISGTGLT